MPFGFRKFRPTRDKKSTGANAHITNPLGKKSLVLVGLMGAGKTSIGRRLANDLNLRFTDADTEIENAARLTISEIFAQHGEDYFRAGERKVIKRLLKDGPQILATGGGAYMNEQTRKEVKTRGVSIWLKADLDLLLARVTRRDHRPLLMNGDPEIIMRRLIEERYPVYAQADITVTTREAPHEEIVGEIIDKLGSYFGDKS